MCMQIVFSKWPCRALVLCVAFVGLQLNAADALKKEATVKPRAVQDSASVQFPQFIDVSACAGKSLQWSSQSIQVDHATGTFNTTWSPNEPNVLNVSGTMTATTFQANLKCANGTGPTGTINATGSNNSFTGTYVLGGNSGPVTISITPGTGGGGGGDGIPTITASLIPDPAKVGDTITVKGTVTLPTGVKLTSDDMGTLTWGDGSAPISMVATDFIASIQSGKFQHVYQSSGIFDVHLFLFNQKDIMPGSGANYDFFAIIGAASVSVDASTGASISAQVSSGANVALQIDATRISGATGATTGFEDSNGAVLPPPNGPLTGFGVQQSLGVSGLALATTQIKDANNGVLAKLRKTVGISDRLAGDPNGLMDPASTSFEVKSLKGKFAFNLSQPDDAIFSGSFRLAPGFSLSRSGANIMHFGMGNCVDTVTLDSKGNAARGNRMRIKKVSIKFPKLTNGVATGGEIAKITIEYNATGLTTAGFESEGITQNLGVGEKGAKNVTRFIQMNMTFGGVAYESLVPVSFGLSSDSLFGTIQGRH